MICLNELCNLNCVEEFSTKITILKIEYCPMSYPQHKRTYAQTRANKRGIKTGWQVPTWYINFNQKGDPAMAKKVKTNGKKRIRTSLPKH